MPFIFLTASDDVQTVSAAAQLGARGYLVKPVTPSQVSAEIEACLSRSRESLSRGRGRGIGYRRVAPGLVMRSQGIGREDALRLLQGIGYPRNLILRLLSEQLGNAHEAYAQSRQTAGTEPSLAALFKDELNPDTAG